MIHICHQTWTNFINFEQYLNVKYIFLSTMPIINLNGMLISVAERNLLLDGPKSLAMLVYSDKMLCLFQIQFAFVLTVHA